MKKRLLQFFFSEKGISWFIWVTLVGAAFFASSRSQWASLFVILLTLFFTLVPALLHRWYAIKLPQVIALIGVLFAYCSLFLGEIHDFYERFWWWDIGLHGSSAVVFGLIGVGAMRMMQSAGTIDGNASVVALFGFTFALAIGAAWEIIEFLIDLVFGTEMQKGLQDTMSDLIVDGLGAFVVTILAYLQWKYGKKNFVGETVESFIEKYRNRMSR